MPESDRRPDRSFLPVYGGIFFVAAAVLLFQIALTRIFAIMMWHHFAYMVVSLALLGFGASGSILTAMRVGEKGGRPFPSPAIFASLFGVTTVLAFAAVTRLEVNSLELWKEPANALMLLLHFVILSVPFLFGGICIGATLSRHADRIGKLYFVDLVGSALGGAVAPMLLGWIGSTATVVVAALVAAFAGLVFSWRGGWAGRFATLVPTLALAALLVASQGGFSIPERLAGVDVPEAVVGRGIPEVSWSVPFAPNKDVPRKFPEGRSDLVLHSAVAQVDVSLPTKFPVSIGGQFGDVDWQEVVLRGVTQDGTAPTTIYENAREVLDFKSLDDTNAASGYVALEARGAKNPDVLVIGVGGGPDLMVGLYHDARSIVGVEINAAMLRMLEDDLKDFTGGLVDDPRIELVHQDGRSYLRHTKKTFDLIQLSGVDTFTALSTGAYTLSESYLYTVEAVRDLYRRLEPGGYVHYSRFLMEPPQGPRETIRLVNVIQTALAEEGVEEPWRNICVLQAHGWASTLIKNGAFTTAEIEALRAFCKKERFRGLVFDPLRPRGEFGPEGNLSVRFHYRIAAQRALREARELMSVGQAAATLPAVVAAVTTAFQQAHEGNLDASDEALAGFVAALPAAERGPVKTRLAKVRDEEIVGWDRTRAAFRQMQGEFDTLLRGTPDEKAKFIDDFFYDLSPSTDDRPFFFNYYKLSRSGQAWKNRGSWGGGVEEYHPGFPVGHMVLYSSLAGIALLAVLLILLPLRKLRRQGVPTPGKGRYFLYFAGLGIGFMFLEIALMQKFILFLGHPTDALSFVLSGMLAFAGLGALVSSSLRPTKGTLLVLGVFVVGFIVLNRFYLDAYLAPFFGAARWARIGITWLVLAPTAFVLGMPFPLGIRVVEDRAAVLIPWAWAINGFLSVFSSLLAIVLAMEIGGFGNVLMLAAGVYALGFLVVPGITRRTS